MKKYFLFAMTTFIIIPNLFSCNSINVDKVSIKGSNKLDIGETTTFTSEVLPKEATSKVLNWSSSDPNIAYVDKNGNVTGINEGKVEIVASSPNGVKDSKTILIGGFISTHVTSLSLTAEKNEIEEGEQIYLNTSILPEDADDKTIKFKSSNEEVATINSYGVIKGEQKSDTPVSIIAISEDGNIKAEFKITVKERKEKRLIKGFAEPKLKTEYKNKVNNLEDVIDSNQINKDNSKNYVNTNFYKDDFNNTVYKVGTLNAFKYKSIISWGNDEWQDYSDDNPYQSYNLEIKNGENWINGNDYIEKTNYKNNEFYFKDTAINNIFRLTISPNKDIYNGVTDEMKSELIFKVVKGYNVYNFNDFTTIDNWTIERAKRIIGEDKEIFTKNEFVECWKEFKEENNIPTNIDINSIILHSDLSISSKDLPKYIAWTKHETDDFINGVKDPVTKERFNNFVEIKSNIYQEEWKELPYEVRKAKCRYMLEGSIKDTTVFFRVQENEDFYFEGNFFTIDISKIKPVIAFNNQNFDNYQKVATHRAALITFGPTGDNHWKTSEGGELRYDDFRPYYGFDAFNEYKYYVNNVHFKGDGIKNDTSDDGIGGLNCFNEHGYFEMNNCIINEFTCGIYCAFAKYENSYTKLNKCKFFNMFANYLRASGSRAIEINDSFFTDAGGLGIMIFENNKTKFESKIHQYSTLKNKNTYIECFVTGNEVYNKGNIAGILVPILASVGLNAFEKYKNLDYGKFTCDHRNFIKIEDGQVYVNLVIMHRFTQTLCPVLYEDGLFTFEDNGNMVMDLPTDSKSDSVFNIYSQLDTVASISFKSSKGGHARVPLYKIAEADDLEIYDKNINPESEELTDHTTTLSNYVDHKEEFDKNIPSVTENLAKLFSGDYLTMYIKPIACKMFGFVLGYK